MWWGDGIGWAGWIAMTLGMVAFWGLIVLGLVTLFRSGSTTNSAREAPGAHTPEQLLDERFARGELDADEYLARRSVLRSRQ